MSDVENYQIYLEILLDMISKNPKIVKNLYKFSCEDNYKKYIPYTMKWFIDNCPDKSVKNLNDFKKWAGIKKRTIDLSKEECIELIYKKQKEYNRPLMYDDFRNPDYGDVSLHMIRKYWGTINKMKKDLELEIIQESMIDRSLSKEEYEKQYNKLILYLQNNNYKYVTQRDIEDILKQNDCNAFSSMNKYTHIYYNMSLVNRINQDGFEIGNCGYGYRIDFGDGEITDSYFEYLFSNFIRKHGFILNKNFFRNVKYIDIDPTIPNNTWTCDYVLIINGEKYYIEIAGFIEAFKRYFFSDIIIERNEAKENYRLKLKEKQKILEKNNLKYFILFPCDLTNENMDKIITEPSWNLKIDMENFIQNNIDWNRVRKLGKLDYSDKHIFRYKRRS